MFDNLLHYIKKQLKDKTTKKVSLHWQFLKSCQFCFKVTSIFALFLKNFPIRCIGNGKENGKYCLLSKDINDINNITLLKMHLLSV